MKLSGIKLSSVYLYGLRYRLYSVAYNKIWSELRFSMQDQLWNPGTGALDRNIGDMIENEIENHEDIIN